MTHSGNTDHEISNAINDLIAAGRLLESKGLGRTQIYDILRKNLPESNYQKKLNETAIRHIQMMREVFNGSHPSEVRAKHGLSYAGRKKVLNDGARKICKILNLHSILVFDRSPMEDINREFWLTHADKAESSLQEYMCQDEKEGH